MLQQISDLAVGLLPSFVFGKDGSHLVRVDPHIDHTFEEIEDQGLPSNHVDKKHKEPQACIMQSHEIISYTGTHCNAIDTYPNPTLQNSTSLSHTSPWVCFRMPIFPIIPCFPIKPETHQHHAIRKKSIYHGFHAGFEFPPRPPPISSTIFILLLDRSGSIELRLPDPTLAIALGGLDL